MVKEWQKKPLESVYVAVFMDVIHCYVRNDGCIVKKVAYIALGVDMDG